jgi:hypothetical protein
MNTFEITKELEAIRLLTETEQFDEDTGELIDNSDEIKQRLDAIGIKRDDKLKAIEYIKREYLSMGERVDFETKRLKERKSSFDKKVDKLADLQKYLLGGEKVETDLFTFSFKKSTKLITDDKELIPDKYKTVEKVEVVTFDNKQLKKDLMDNDELVVKGVHLEHNQNLQVK